MSAASWRDALPIHPAADLFPPMGTEELRALGEDILKHGLTSPIVLWRALPKGQALLLDGRNRLDAMEIVTGNEVVVGPPSVMAGKNFLALNKVVVLDKSVDPWTYVVSANINRRHLTADDKRRIIAALIKANPQKSDRQIAKLVDASPTTVGDERKKTCPDLDTSIDTKGRRQPRKKPPRKRLKKQKATDSPPEIDIGANSAGEIERLRARNEELEHKVRRLEIENAGLRSEVDELKADLAKRPPLAADDPGPIPAFLRRGVKP